MCKSSSKTGTSGDPNRLIEGAFGFIPVEWEPTVTFKQRAHLQSLVIVLPFFKVILPVHDGSLVEIPVSIGRAVWRCLEGDDAASYFRQDPQTRTHQGVAARNETFLRNMQKEANSRKHAKQRHFSEGATYNEVLLRVEPLKVDGACNARGGERLCQTSTLRTEQGRGAKRPADDALHDVLDRRSSSMTTTGILSSSFPSTPSASGIVAARLRLSQPLRNLGPLAGVLPSGGIAAERRGAT